MRLSLVSEMIGLQVIFFGVLLMLHNPLLSFIPENTLLSIMLVFIGSFMFLLATNKKPLFEVIKTVAGFFVALAFYGVISQNGANSILQIDFTQTFLQALVGIFVLVLSATKIFKPT